MCVRDAPILVRVVIAGSDPFQVATLTLYLDTLTTRKIRTVAFVAGSRTDVAAIKARLCAFLLAFLFGRSARAQVTNLLALVVAAEQCLVAGQAAAEGLLKAGDCLALLVFPIAPFGGQHDAGRTLRHCVAVVQDWMLAVGVRAGARLIAFRSLSAAGDWWIDNGRSTLTGKLIKARTITWDAIAGVTTNLASMAAA